MLARAALESPLTDEELDTIIEALTASLRLCSSQEWMDSDDDHHFMEERRCGVGNLPALGRRGPHTQPGDEGGARIGRVVADASSDYDAFRGATDAMRRWPSTSPLKVPRRSLLCRRGCESLTLALSGPHRACVKLRMIGGGRHSRTSRLGPTRRSTPRRARSTHRRVLGRGAGSLRRCHRQGHRRSG